MILAGAGYVFWELKGDSFIESQIIKEIDNMGLSVDSISVDYPGKTLVLHNINFLPIAFGEKADRILEKYPDISSTAESVEITGISWTKLKTSGRLQARKLIIEGLEANMLLPLDKYLVDDPLSLIKSVSFDSVIVLAKKSKVYRSDKTKDESYTSINSGSFRINDFFYKKGRKLELTSIENFASTISNFTYKSNGFSIGLDSINFINKILKVNNLAYESRSGPYLKTALKSLVMYNPDLKKFNEKALVVDSLICRGDFIHLGKSWLNKSKVLDKLQINSIRTGKAVLSCDNVQVFQNGFKEVSLKTVGFNSGEIVINNNSSIKLKDYNCSVSSAERQNLNGHQKTVVKGIKLASNKTELTSLRIFPTQSRSQFSTNRNFVLNQYTLEIPNIKINDDILLQFLNSGKIEIDQLHINGLKSTIYSNSNIQSSKNYKALLSEQILSFPIPFIVRNIKVLGGDFVFELQAKEKNDTGSITMKNINATVENITNIGSMINENQFFNLDLSTMFMGETPFSLRLNMDYTGPNYPYTYSANLASVDFNKINRMLEDLSGAKIQKGEMDKMEFDVKADKYSSKGTMDFLYTNVKMVQVVDLTTKNTDPLKLFVHGVILRRNNRADRHPKQGKINTKRNTQKGMFMQIWEAIFDGIGSILLPRTIFNK